MQIKRVALVTGANRGIGLEIVNQLAHLGIRVYLGSRDAGKGQSAADSLRSNDMDIQPIQLDMDSNNSMEKAIQEIISTENRLDILVNNAGILLDKEGSSLLSDIETLRVTMETNVYGPFRLCQLAIPYMRKQRYGRIVNLSSGMGQFSEMGSGYPAYRMSKTALNSMTAFLSAELQGTNILMNTMCPGWVRTDMGGANATRPVEEGADTAVWLSTLADGGPSGQFFRDRKQIPW